MSLMGFGSLLQSQQDTGSIPETATPPITAVGSEKVQLSLDQAIRLALENNLECIVEITDRPVLGHYFAVPFRPFPVIAHREQQFCMSCADDPIDQTLLDGIVELQEAQGIGDAGALLSDLFRQLFLGQSERLL